MTLQRPSFERFVSARLGNGKPTTVVGHMFRRAFCASELAGFWRFWNPAYGYFLAYFIYAPLRRHFPRPPSLIATFAFSGFALHDALIWMAHLAAGRSFPFPVVTFAFVVVALMILASEALNITLRSLSPLLRALSHALVLTLAFATSIAVASNV